MENASLIFPSGEYSYERLHEQTSKYRKHLKEQITPGTVVALVSDYTFEAIALFFALHELKAIIVPITTRVAVAALEDVLHEHRRAARRRHDAHHYRLRVGGKSRIRLRLYRPD